MIIRVAEQDEEIELCYEVMSVLRPQITAVQFLPRIRQQQTTGYHLAYLIDPHHHPRHPVAVAGFRFLHTLAWGQMLYVDDLVVLPDQRSQGHGATFLRWLADHGRAHHCDQLHLDSGTHRLDAHRFYQREGMDLNSYHFSSPL